jgi:hypothetical protein
LNLAHISEAASAQKLLVFQKPVDTLPAAVMLWELCCHSPAIVYKDRVSKRNLLNFLMVPATVLQIDLNQWNVINSGSSCSVFTSFISTEFFITLLTNCQCLASYQLDSSTVIWYTSRINLCWRPTLTPCNVYICLWQRPLGLRQELTPSSQMARSWVRIPLEAWMSVCVYSASVVLWAGSVPTSSWSNVQGVLLTIGLGNWKSGQGPTKEAIEPSIIIIIM